jgi:hypothetical protein
LHAEWDAKQFKEEIAAVSHSHLAMLQAQDLLDGIDLSVAIDLSHGGIAHIQQLSPAEDNSHSPWAGSSSHIRHVT